MKREAFSECQESAQNRKSQDGTQRAQKSSMRAIMQDDMHPQRVPVADGANWTRQSRVSVVRHVHGHSDRCSLSLRLHKRLVEQTVRPNDGSSKPTMIKVTLGAFTKQPQCCMFRDQDDEQRRRRGTICLPWS